MASAVCVAVILYGRGKQIEYNREANQRHREYSRNTEYPARNSCLILPFQHQADCIAEARHKARENERQEQDLVAQRVTAVWTFIMGSAAVIGMGLSAVGVFLVWTTFHATKEGNRDSKQAAADALAHAKEDTTIDQRAWMQAEITARAQIIGGNLYVIFSFYGSNVGKTPALQIKIATREYNAYEITIEKMRGDATELVDKVSGSGLEGVIFPGLRTRGDGGGFTIDRAKVDAYQPRVMIAIGYNIMGSQDRKITIESFDLMSIKSGETRPIGYGVPVRTGMKIVAKPTGFSYIT